MLGVWIRGVGMSACDEPGHVGAGFGKFRQDCNIILAGYVAHHIDSF